MIRSNKSISIKEWLFNPFEYIAGMKALLIGLIVILLTSLIGSFSNAHFDGVLDLHIGASVDIWVYLAEGLINWISAVVILLIIGKIFSKTKFRLIDFAGTQAMARIPMLISSLVVLIKPFQNYTRYIMNKLLQQFNTVAVGTYDIFIFYFVLIIMISAVIWMCFLMYRSYSLCCNLKGSKAVISFIAGIIIAEIVSKILIKKITLILISLTLCNAPVSAKIPEKNTNSLTKISKNYVLLMNKGKYTEAVKYFDKTMKKGLPESKLKEVWNGLILRHGPFKEFDKSRKTKKAGYDIILLKCKFQKSIVTLKIVFNKKKKISGFWIVGAEPYKK